MRAGVRDVVFLAVIVGATGIMGAGLVHSSGSPSAQPPKPLAVRSDPRTIVETVDGSFRARWVSRKSRSGRSGVRTGRDAPAGPGALRLGPVARRDPPLRGQAEGQARVAAWLDELLADRRCADYLAERFARAFVGTEDGPFLLYRRRRFIAWLSDAILENRPYDALVTRPDRRPGPLDRSSRRPISCPSRSIPDAGRPTPDRLAARVARAFLGARIDCAQCHDHPVSALETGRFSRPGGVLRRRPLQPARHS